MNLTVKLYSIAAFCLCLETNTSHAYDPEDVHVAFVSDQNYPMPVCVSMASMISHSTPAENLNFHIIDLGIKQIDKDRIWNLQRTHGDFSLEFIPYNARKLSQFEGYNWSTAIYAKLLIGDVLQDLDKCILIDGDTIANRNIRALYDLDIGDNYMAILNDYAFTNHNYCRWVQRVNAGSMLLNLDLIREDRLSEKFFNCLASGQSNISLLPADGNLKRTFTEEHTFQTVCANRIYPLPLRYNFLNYLIYPGYNGSIPQRLWDVNARDKTTLHLFEELDNAVIFHYSDMPKIWLTPEWEWRRMKKNMYMRDKWYKHYATTAYDGNCINTPQRPHKQGNQEDVVRPRHTMEQQAMKKHKGSRYA